MPGPDAVQHEAEFTHCLSDRQVYGTFDVGPTVLRGKTVDHDAIPLHRQKIGGCKAAPHYGLDSHHMDVSGIVGE